MSREGKENVQYGQAQPNQQEKGDERNREA